MELLNLNKVQFRKKKFSNSSEHQNKFPVFINSLASKKSIECSLTSTHVNVYNLYDTEYLYLNGCFGTPSLSRKMPEYHRMNNLSKNHPFCKCKHRHMSQKRYEKLKLLKAQNYTNLSKKVLLEMSLKDVDNTIEELNPNLRHQKRPNNILNLMDDEIKHPHKVNDLESICFDKNKKNVEDDRLSSKHSKVKKQKLDNSSNDHMLEVCRDIVDSSHVIVGNVECDNMMTTDNVEYSIKPNPFPFVEHLQLMFEEAFFLSYAFGCLVVYDLEKKVLDTNEQWTTFLSIRKNFLSRYVAYHYYRSRGWVVKCGFKYGSDFVLYKKGPSHYHSTYSVVVCPVYNSSSSKTNDVSECTITDIFKLDKKSNQTVNVLDKSLCNLSSFAANDLNSGMEISTKTTFLGKDSNATLVEGINKSIVNAQNNILSGEGLTNCCESNQLFEPSNMLLTSDSIDLIKDNNFTITDPQLKTIGKISPSKFASNLDNDTLLNTCLDSITSINDSNYNITKPVLETSNQSSSSLENNIFLNKDSSVSKNDFNYIITEPELQTTNKFSSDTFASNLEGNYPLDWDSMSCLSRITEQVGKELVFCHVLFPSNVDISTPNCLSHFKVSELVVKRWISKRERMETQMNI